MGVLVYRARFVPAASSGIGPPPSFGVSGTYYENTSATPAFTAPSGVVAGSVIVIAAYIDGAADPGITLPDGTWSQAEGSPVFADLSGGANDQNHRLLVVWHRAAGSESGPYTMTLSNGSRFVSGQAHRFDDCVTSGTLFDTPTDSDGTDQSGSTSPAVNITTAGTNRLVLHVASCWAGGTWTPPGGYTKRQQGGFGLATLSDKLQAAAGSTGSLTASSTSPDKMQAWAGALIPVSSGGSGGPQSLSLTDTVGLLDSVSGGGSGAQSAVSLVALDGESISGSTQSNFTGNGFWKRVGHTRARDWVGPKPTSGNYAGFDDVNFIPIMTWLTDPGGLTAAAAYGRMNDLGLNGMFPCSGAINLDDLPTYGKWAVVPGSEHAGGTITSTQDPYVLGVSTGEEPSTVGQYDTYVADAAAWLASADGPGRFHGFNFADPLLNGDIGGTYFPDDMVVATPNQITAMDQYWYAGSNPESDAASRYKIHDRLYYPTNLTTPSSTESQCARGCHYGSAVDSIRKAYSSGTRAPFVVWIEAGAPYEAATSKAMTPTVLKWAVWSTFVHGARTIGYFVHNFRIGDTWGSAFWDDHFGGPGVAGTGIYAAAKEVNLRALAIAPVMNSPFDGYFVYGDTENSGSIATAGFLTAVTSTNARSKYAGVDASCRWLPTAGKHYILSTTREPDGTTNVPVTFRMVDQGQTTAVEIHESNSITIQRGGSIPGGFCEFSDTFATAASYKTYRID